MAYRTTYTSTITVPVYASWKCEGCGELNFTTGAIACRRDSSTISFSKSDHEEARAKAASSAESEWLGEAYKIISDPNHNAAVMYTNLAWNNTNCSKCGTKPRWDKNAKALRLMGLFISATILGVYGVVVEPKNPAGWLCLVAAAIYFIWIFARASIYENELITLPKQYTPVFGTKNAELIDYAKVRGKTIPDPDECMAIVQRYSQKTNVSFNKTNVNMGTTGAHATTNPSSSLAQTQTSVLARIVATAEQPITNTNISPSSNTPHSSDNPLATKFCTMCGQRIGLSDKFCEKCGATVDAPKTTRSTTPKNICCPSCGTYYIAAPVCSYCGAKNGNYRATNSYAPHEVKPEVKHIELDNMKASKIVGFEPYYDAYKVLFKNVAPPTISEAHSDYVSRPRNRAEFECKCFMAFMHHLSTRVDEYSEINSMSYMSKLLLHISQREAFDSRMCDYVEIDLSGKTLPYMELLLDKLDPSIRAQAENCEALNHIYAFTVFCISAKLFAKQRSFDDLSDLSEATYLYYFEQDASRIFEEALKTYNALVDVERLDYSSSEVKEQPEANETAKDTSVSRNIEKKALNDPLEVSDFFPSKNRDAQSGVILTYLGRQLFGNDFVYIVEDLANIKSPSRIAFELYLTTFRTHSWGLNETAIVDSAPMFYHEVRGITNITEDDIITALSIVLLVKADNEFLPNSTTNSLINKIKEQLYNHKQFRANNVEWEKMSLSSDDFGRSLEHPIFVESAVAVDDYFTNYIAHSSQKPLSYKRTETEIVIDHGAIDKYEIYIDDEKIDELYVCIYGKDTAEKAPSGYILKTRTKEENDASQVSNKTYNNLDNEEHQDDSSPATDEKPKMNETQPSSSVTTPEAQDSVPSANSDIHYFRDTIIALLATGAILGIVWWICNTIT